MNPEDWLKERAPGYGCLRETEIESVKHFCLLWSFFEFQCLGTEASYAKIVETVEKISKNDQFQANQFKEPLSYFKSRYISATGFNEKFKSLNFRSNDRRTLVEKVLNGELSGTKDIMTALLIIIFRIRNNVMHGVKWAYSIHGQQANFDYANIVLMIALNIFMDG